MSLLGRLEDLSLTDIVQIVFLSRRTGILEIVDKDGRHTVMFWQGLVINASAPEHPDLATYLVRRGLIPADSLKIIRQMEDSGVPCGTAAVELNLLSQDMLGQAIRDRILSVVTPLLESREGEFNFLLSESMSGMDIEYEPDLVFKEGGFAPQKILGAPEGEKLKPLRGLEESLKAGKALLRTAAAETTPPSLDIRPAPMPDEAPVVPPPPVPTPEEPPVRTPALHQAELVFETEEEPPVRTPALHQTAPVSPPVPEGQSGGTAAALQNQFKVAGGLFDVESPEATYRNVVLFERDPLIRVAAKRAFAKAKVRISQFGSLEDTRAAMTDLFRSNIFFVTFLELTDDDASPRLMQQLKRRNPRLPVVMVDRQTDLRRRHDLLRLGADLYLTKPAPERLQPEQAEEELSLFADELVLFAERAYDQWEQVTGGYGPEAGRRFYEIADKDNINRSFGVLKQLINELSNPTDISQVTATILRLSSQYLDRGVLFLADENEFVGLSGFGGAGDEMTRRAKAMRISRREPSLLGDVAESRQPHHGKIRRTAVNVQLIEGLGGLLPTEVVALPILHDGKVIGILYGDNAEHRGPIDSMAGLEIFLSQAGYAFRNAVAVAGRGQEGA